MIVACQWNMSSATGPYINNKNLTNKDSSSNSNLTTTSNRDISAVTYNKKNVTNKTQISIITTTSIETYQDNQVTKEKVHLEFIIRPNKPETKKKSKLCQKNSKRILFLYESKY